LPVAIRPGSRATHNADIRLKDYVVGIADKPFDPTINHRKFNLHVKMNYKSGQMLPLNLIKAVAKCGWIYRFIRSFCPHEQDPSIFELSPTVDCCFLGNPSAGCGAFVSVWCDRGLPILRQDQ